MSLLGLDQANWYSISQEYEQKKANEAKSILAQTYVSRLNILRHQLYAMVLHVSLY